MSTWRQAWVLAAIMLLGAARTGTAHAEVIERVVAVVNDDAVWLSELRRKAAPYIESVVAEAANENERSERLQQMYSQILQQLIDELLIDQTARTMQLGVTSAEVEQAITNVQQQNQMSAEQFWQAVQAQGFTEAQYRADVRKQLLRLKVSNQRLRGRVNITEEDVRERYDTAARQARRSQRFRAAHIFIELPEQAAATDVAAAKRRADELRATLTPETFEAAMTAHGGIELGWLSQGDLPDALEQELLRLEPGQISVPVRGPAGIHIFLLQERQAGSSALPSYEEAREQIYRQMLEESMGRQEQMFLTELRRNAVIRVQN